MYRPPLGRPEAIRAVHAATNKIRGRSNSTHLFEAAVQVSGPLVKRMARSRRRSLWFKANAAGFAMTGPTGDLLEEGSPGAVSLCT